MTYQQAMRKLYTDMQLRGFSELTIDAYFLNVKRWLYLTSYVETSFSDVSFLLSTS